MHELESQASGTGGWADYSSLGDNLIVAEFTSLRTEILQRIQFQHLTIGLTLTFAGALLTYAASDKGHVLPDILWGYPLLVLGLAILWSFDNMRIVQISEYLHADVEPLLKGRTPAGWQHFLGSKRCQTPLYQCRLSGITAAMAIFCLMPLFVLVAGGLSRPDWNPVDWGYLALDLVVIVVTVTLVRISDLRPRPLRPGGGAAGAA